MTALLTIKNLTVTLQDKKVITSLELLLDEGEILGLVGPSGCGKTTLLNTIAGFVKPAKGQIFVEEKLLNDGQKSLPAEQRQVGMIFQDYALFPHLTVFQNIAFGISQLDKEKQNEIVNELLHTLKLSEYGNSFIHQLSGGQQQRVAIARALAPKPKLLLLDEPFSNIDARLRNELMIEIRLLLKNFNTTAIFVTHNKDEVFTFADKMAVMSNGKLLQFDKPNIICQQPNSYQVADFLQLGSWLPCQVSSSYANSLLGKLNFSSSSSNTLVHLLVKPQNIVLVRDESVKANAQVQSISVTEQGYHYHLSSLDGHTEKNSKIEHSLTFEKLSLYSETLLCLDQQVSVKIQPHNYLYFESIR